ncbi:MAG: hypothetical protein CENE_03151 [Candidatus Celerinatantimonas neptuna]|nr:MAG: hypothetical protein CENE_03151 [Candidatus Celerinatantimonas neptuna]
MPYNKQHKDRTRSKILRSASSLFARYGFDKISIGQIMKDANLTHGAFYAHFESKEALYAACFVGVLKECSGSRLVKQPLSVSNLLKLANNFRGLHQSGTVMEPGPEAILFNETSSDNARIRQLFQLSYDYIRNMLEKRITALSRIKRKNLSSEMVKENARAILVSLVGAVTLAKMIPDEDEREQLLKTAQSHILSVLK